MNQLDTAVERYRKLILDELKDEAKSRCWIAGGSIRDYFMGVPVKTDYDLFFPNGIEFKNAYDYMVSKGAEVVWESDNGIKLQYNGKKYDLVKKYFDTPERTISEFDFTVSMVAVDTEQVYYSDTFFIDLAKRQLIINKITYPPSTMSRAFRYYEKGFRMCVGEMAKIVKSIQDMPKEEPTENNNTEPDNTENMSSMELAVMFGGVD